MRVRIRRLVCIAGLLAAVAATVLSAAQTPFTRIVVFGTSLSDSGNAFALTGQQSVPPDYGLDPFLVPGAPYARGGHHFSNGATWIEQFARSRGLAGSVRPAFASSDPNATNFAIGGARAAGSTASGLTVQVGAFFERFGNQAPSDALYIIEMGGNDIRDAIGLYLANDGPGGDALLGAAAQTIASSVQMLYTAGARHFLVWRAPDIGLTPSVLMTGDPQLGGLATFLSSEFNGDLDSDLGPLAALPGITIARLDSFALLHAANLNPSMFGLTNTTDACVMPNVPPFSCQQPDQFLFWDGIHPTGAGHAILAQAAAQALSQ